MSNFRGKWHLFQFALGFALVCFGSKCWGGEVPAPDGIAHFGEVNRLIYRGGDQQTPEARD